MSIRRQVQLLAMIISVAMGCMVVDIPEALTPTTPAYTPVATRTLPPLLRKTPPPVIASPETLPFPAWVAEFSDPILVSIAGRTPDYKDDFTQFNLGWFYFVAGDRRGPFYAHLQEGTLWVKLPEGKEARDSMVYNPWLIRKDFVLSLDFQFEPTQPPDSVRFEFSQSADRSFAVDFFKNKTWALRWGPHNNWQLLTGTYDYLAPERISVFVIMRGEECAVYLNNEPLGYVNGCRPGAIVRSVPWAASFHVLAAPGHDAVASFDNLKLWDLDKIPASE